VESIAHFIVNPELDLASCWQFQLLHFLSKCDFESTGGFLILLQMTWAGALESPAELSQLIVDGVGAEFNPKSEVN
jgi:hypothetical protein